jgi:hypothetical protein
VQNIGAYGVELQDRFEALDAIDLETGRVFTLDAAQCGCGYRDSVFKHAAGGLDGLGLAKVGGPPERRPSIIGPLVDLTARGAEQYGRALGTVIGLMERCATTIRVGPVDDLPMTTPPLTQGLHLGHLPVIGRLPKLLARFIVGWVNIRKFAHYL